MSDDDPVVSMLQQGPMPQARGSMLDRPFWDTEVVVADPAWWLDHIDELIDGLRQAAGPEPILRLPDRDLRRRRLKRPPRGRVLISHPTWWIFHADELEAAIREAVRVDRAG